MTQKQLVLQVLRDAGAAGVTTGEFLAHPDVGSRFGARIQELRDDGERIVTQLLAKGSSRYTLKAPAAPRMPQAAPVRDLVPPEAQGHVQPSVAPEPPPECAICGCELPEGDPDWDICDGCQGIR